jgi:hypothetical protein
MYIQRDTLAFIQPVCSTVTSGDGRREGLLSIPFTFANYFCAVPPYRDHVQTWYDISSAASIKDLIDSLQQSPPLWILYESQPETLQVHENLFNGGKPIPYSDLAAFIRKKVDDGSWKVTYTSSYGGAREWTGQWFSQRWFLIRTN